MLFFSFISVGMRDQFSRLLEDSGLVPSTNSGGAVNNFSGNMELVKVRKAQDPGGFRRFFACDKMTLFFSFFSSSKNINKQAIKILKILTGLPEKMIYNNNGP